MTRMTFELRRRRPIIAGRGRRYRRPTRPDREIRTRGRIGSASLGSAISREYRLGPLRNGKGQKGEAESVDGPPAGVHIRDRLSTDLTASNDEIDRGNCSFAEAASAIQKPPRRIDTVDSAKPARAQASPDAVGLRTRNLREPVLRCRGSEAVSYVPTSGLRTNRRARPQCRSGRVHHRAHARPRVIVHMSAPESPDPPVGSACRDLPVPRRLEPVKEMPVEADRLVAEVRKTRCAKGAQCGFRNGSAPHGGEASGRLRHPPLGTDEPAFASARTERSRTCSRR